MNTATATAVFECDGELFVSCPHCSNIHKYKTADTPRLIEIPAMCDDTLKYVVTATMKPRNFTACLHLYKYESKRKSEQYRKRKERKAPPSSAPPAEA
jgi:hypothetical protein